MTVAELKELLSAMPDDAPVIVGIACDFDYNSGEAEIVHLEQSRNGYEVWIKY
jgi:hypothetical protein